ATRFALPKTSVLRLIAPDVAALRLAVATLDKPIANCPDAWAVIPVTVAVVTKSIDKVPDNLEIEFAPPCVVRAKELEPAALTILFGDAETPKNNDETPLDGDLRPAEA